MRQDSETNIIVLNTALKMYLCTGDCEASAADDDGILMIS